MLINPPFTAATPTLSFLSSVPTASPWNTRLTSAGPKTDYVNALARDAAGNLYITGRTEGGFPALHSMRPGTPGVFVAKFNSAGVLQYSTIYGDDAGSVVQSQRTPPVRHTLLDTRTNRISPSQLEHIVPPVPFLPVRSWPKSIPLEQVWVTRLTSAPTTPPPMPSRLTAITTFISQAAPAAVFRSRAQRSRRPSAGAPMTASSPS